MHGPYLDSESSAYHLPVHLPTRQLPGVDPTQTSRSNVQELKVSGGPPATSLPLGLLREQGTSHCSFALFHDWGLTCPLPAVSPLKVSKGVSSHAR